MSARYQFGVREPREATSSKSWEIDPDRPLADLKPREVGIEGEEIAASYLERRGYEILERNWRHGRREADIVVRDNETVVLVEVKTRSCLGEDFREVMPELAVNAKKQEGYRSLALGYISEHPEVHSIRFDVIAINLVARRTASLRHLVGAYEWDD